MFNFIFLFLTLFFLQFSFIFSSYDNVSIYPNDYDMKLDSRIKEKKLYDFPYSINAMTKGLQFLKFKYNCAHLSIRLFAKQKYYDKYILQTKINEEDFIDFYNSDCKRVFLEKKINESGEKLVFNYCKTSKDMLNKNNLRFQEKTNKYETNEEENMFKHLVALKNILNKNISSEKKNSLQFYLAKITPYENCNFVEIVTNEEQDILYSSSMDDITKNSIRDEYKKIIDHLDDVLEQKRVQFAEHALKTWLYPPYNDGEEYFAEYEVNCKEKVKKKKKIELYDWDKIIEFDNKEDIKAYIKNENFKKNIKLFISAITLAGGGCAVFFQYPKLQKKILHVSSLLHKKQNTIKPSL